MLDRIRRMFVNGSGLLIVIFAALLLELLSAAQYYLTHQLMEEELEKRSEGELRLKAVLIKSTLNSTESILRDFVWKFQSHLEEPDSAAMTVLRMAKLGSHLQGVAIGFDPYYYPEKGKWYEPYARRGANGEVEVKDIGGPAHDYFQTEFYQKVSPGTEGVWVDPYIDSVGARDTVTSFFLPVKDYSGKVAAVVGADVSIEWLRDTIDGRHVYPSSFVLLLTEDGKPIIQPGEDRVGKATVEHVISLVNDSTVAPDKSRSGRSKIKTFDIDGRKGRVIFANMKGRPSWQLAIACYDDEVFASLMQLRLKMLVIMLLAFGILLGMIAAFRRKDEKLRKKTREQENINKELQIASDIQQALLPNADDYKSSTTEPPLARPKDAWRSPRTSPQRGEQSSSTDIGSEYVQVVGLLIPAKTVGGDLYNAFIRDGKLYFCIGDVAGKGIPAALIMAITQTLFRNIAEHGSNPAHIMEELNRAACRNNKSNIFVTLFIGVLDLPTGRLRYCNAGHEVPILIDHSSLTIDHSPLTIDHSAAHSNNGQRSMVNVQLFDVKPNLPIGIFHDFKYQLQEMKMEKGDTLFLYTDGLTEAKNAEKKLLGREHVMELVSASAKAMTQSLEASPTQLLVDSVVEQWKEFAGGTEQSDDMTLLAISYTPLEEKFVLDETLTLKNDVKEVAKLSTFIKDVMSRLNIDKSLASKLRLALEEAVVNVMEYAYPAGSLGDVDIRVTFVQHPARPKGTLAEQRGARTPNIQHLRFVITDTGISFDPTQASMADTTLSAEERPVGGLGILLVRELMDFINYERIDGKNVLILEKRINDNQ